MREWTPASRSDFEQTGLRYTRIKGDIMVGVFEEAFATRGQRYCSMIRRRTNFYGSTEWTAWYDRRGHRKLSEAAARWEGLP